MSLDRALTIQRYPICFERYPSPAALAGTSEKTLANRPIKLAPRMGKGLAAEIVQALSEQAVTVPGTQAATIVMPSLAQRLAALRKQRDEVAGEVERLVLAHPLWQVLTSMPGVGVRTAARLLTEVAYKRPVQKPPEGAVYFLGKQYASEVGKVTLWMFAATIRCIGKPDRRRFVRTTASIIAHIYPEPAGLRPAVARREHRQRRVVGVDLDATERMATHRVDQRVEQPRQTAQPVAHGARFDLDAVARVHDGLAIERE